MPTACSSRSSTSPGPRRSRRKKLRPSSPAAAGGARWPRRTWANPDLPNSQVERLLFEAAVDVTAPGRDIETGWGRIDAAAAVQAARDAVAEFVMLRDSVGGITNTSATVSWGTNLPSTGRISYGT